MTDETGDAADDGSASTEERRADADRDVPRENVFASGSEGRTYRGSSYVPTAYDNLDVAPDRGSFPARGSARGDGVDRREDPNRGDGDRRRDERDGDERGGHGDRRGDESGETDGFRLLDLPLVPKLTHVLGPSAILLGASLGSGETLFWPLLVAQHGWGVYWLFVVGVCTQFFLNTEIQRWTVATGESVFRGFERVARGWPLVFLAFGLLSLGWPGWAATAAKIGATGLGLSSLTVPGLGVSVPAWRVVGIALLAVIWLSYQVSPLMYNVVERTQVVLVSVSVVVAVALFVAVGDPAELARAPAGLVDPGGLPPRTDVALLLGGIAFAGAGGYLNLSQSLWVREKGYGMGRYQGRIKNPVVGDAPEPVQRDGFTFPPTRTNMRRWRGWWRLVQLEHFLTFVVGLLVVATLLMALASSHAPVGTEDAVEMWTSVVVPAVGPVAGAAVFAVLFVALATTEYAIVESFVRNSADVVYELHGRSAGWSLPRIFWWLLTGFTLWGVVILAVPLPVAVEDPFGLLVVGAAMSGLMMWPYTAVLAVLNTTRLPEHLQPGWVRLATLWWATAFFGYFGALLVGNWLDTLAGLSVFATEMGVLGSAPGGYVLFAAVGVVEVVVVAVTARAKRRARGSVDWATEAGGLLG